MNRAGLAAVVFLALAPHAALAQADAPVESVTVEAPKEARPTPFLTGGSRWMSSICPVSVGLTPEQNRRVIDRINAVAALVGAPWWRAMGRCNTNAEIVFTDKPQDFLDAVADRRYQLLGNISAAQARTAATMRYPVQSWYSAVWMDEQGGMQLMPPDENDCDPYCFFRGSGPERIVIGTVIIVVDVNKARGRTLTALSDYVALMALTQARAFARCQPAPSIANLMAPDCAGEMQPDGLTAGDIAWMRGLYRMSAERARTMDEEALAATETRARGGK